MIDIKTEDFTAAEAVEAGLIDTIKRGEAKVTGTYELLTDGYLHFGQNKIVFKDKFGELRSGYFADDTELCDFFDKYGETFDNETDDE